MEKTNTIKMYLAAIAIAACCLQPTQALADDIFEGFIPCTKNGKCANKAGDKDDDEVGRIGAEIPDNFGGDIIDATPPPPPPPPEDEEIVEPNSSLCKAPTQPTLGNVFVPEAEGIDNTVKDCKLWGCRGGNLVFKPKDDDITEEAKKCNKCDKGNLSPQSGSCEDGLFCTSATGNEVGPDICTLGRCTGQPIGDKTGQWSVGVGFDFGELSKFLQKVRNFKKVVDSIKGHRGRNGSGSDGVESTGSLVPTIEVRTRSAEECCEEQKAFVEGREYEGSIAISPLKFEWQSPSAPLPIFPAVKIGFDIEIGASLNGIIKGIDSECDSGCGKPDAEVQGSVTIGGGPYLAAFHPRFLKLSGTVSGRAGIDAKFKCLGPAEFSPACVHEVTVGAKVTFLGGLSKDFTRAIPIQGVCL